MLIIILLMIIRYIQNIKYPIGINKYIISYLKNIHWTMGIINIYFKHSSLLAVMLNKTL